MEAQKRSSRSKLPTRAVIRPACSNRPPPEQVWIESTHMFVLKAQMPDYSYNPIRLRSSRKVEVHRRGSYPAGTDTRCPWCGSLKAWGWAMAYGVTWSSVLGTNISRHCLGIEWAASSSALGCLSCVPRPLPKHRCFLSAVASEVCRPFGALSDWTHSTGGFCSVWRFRVTVGERSVPPAGKAQPVVSCTSWEHVTDLYTFRRQKGKKNTVDDCLLPWGTVGNATNGKQLITLTWPLLAERLKSQVK